VQRQPGEDRVSIARTMDFPSFETGYPCPQIWRDAAMHGVLEALESLGELAIQISVHHVLGVVVDTTVNAVACAAALATFEALGYEQPSVLERPPWSIIEP
jgi:hypothetical protein